MTAALIAAAPYIAAWFAASPIVGLIVGPWLKGRAA